MSESIREGYVKKGGLKPEPKEGTKPDNYNPPPQSPKQESTKSSTESGEKK